MKIIQNIKNKLLVVELKSVVMPLVALIAGIVLISTGCEKNTEDDYTADFKFEYVDDNHVQFENLSEGEYYSVIWNFGNGVADTTTDKKKTYKIYYPVAGDFTASVRLTNYVGGSKTTEKTVSITNSDLIVSFTAEIDVENPNYVNLVNTSQGKYDSIKWYYRNEVIVDENEIQAYFPFAGDQEIELEAFVYNTSYSEMQTVTIAQDDPNYDPEYTLVWEDEFDGTSVNLDNWTFETGATGWGNNELQNYTDGENAEIVDGKLVITARKVDDNTEVGSYTSSRMVTLGKQEFKYGRMEIRANLPEGRGIWPAIWMLGSNITSVGWPACGEIDIMEYVGYDPNIVHATVHTSAGHGVDGDGSSYFLETCEEEFHNYGAIWTADKIEFYVDSPDNVIHTYAPDVQTDDNWPFDKPAFFILNIAVGGNWGGAQGVDNSIFPQTMEIDYVRVYQQVDK